MPRISRRSLAQLPSVDEVWFITTVQLRMWISPEDAPPSRPYAIFIVDLDHGLIMALDLTETEPTPEQVRDSLFKAMSKPAKVTGPARRPKAIGVADPYLGEALTGLIGEARLEMTIYEMQTPEEFSEIVREMELQLHHGKPELAAGFFAAAYFYRAAGTPDQQSDACRATPGRAGLSLRRGNGQRRRRVRAGNVPDLGRCRADV